MDNSSFGEYVDFFSLTEVLPLDNNGATSDTYKVRVNGKWHFMKRSKREYVNHPIYNAAFRKEFDVGYTLEHPNIVRYVFKGEDKEGFYFLTEYIDGNTLDKFLINNPNYFKNTEHFQKFTQQLLSALSYLHSKQILHLDLKPENILITTIGHDVKIIDLGFSYSDCYQFITAGKTERYAAPEQLNGSKIDQRTDIYGIGGILLYCLSQTFDKKQLSKLPFKYRNIIGICLEVNPDSRFPNIQALQNSLNKKNKGKYLAISLITVLLLILVAFLFNPYIENQQHSRDAMRDSIANLRNTVDTLIVRKDTEISSNRTLDLSDTKTDKESVYVQKEQQTRETMRDSIANLREISDSLLMRNTVPNISNNSLAETKNDVESKKELNLESYKITINPTPLELSRDSFCSVIKEKSRKELDDIYDTSDADVYSVQDQENRFSKTVEIYKLFVESIEDRSLKNDVLYMFWDEHKHASASYYQKQALAFFEETKKFAIPDSITQKEDVYRLLDKKSANLFVKFVKENTMIKNDEQYQEIHQIYTQYLAMRDSVFEEYKHLYQRHDDFLTELGWNGHNRIRHSQNWPTNMMTLYQGW